MLGIESRTWLMLNRCSASGLPYVPLLLYCCVLVCGYVWEWETERQRAPWYVCGAQRATLWSLFSSFTSTWVSRMNSGLQAYPAHASICWVTLLTHVTILSTWISISFVAQSTIEFQIPYVQVSLLPLRFCSSWWVKSGVNLSLLVLFVEKCVHCETTSFCVLYIASFFSVVNTLCPGICQVYFIFFGCLKFRYKDQLPRGITFSGGVLCYELRWMGTVKSTANGFLMKRFLQY